MTAALDDGRESRRPGPLRRMIFVPGLWLLAAFGVGMLADLLAAPLLWKGERVSSVSCHLWFWEDGETVRLGWTDARATDEPPAGVIVIRPDRASYEPSGVFFRTRVGAWGLVGGYFYDDRPDPVIATERLDQWRPAIADAMTRNGSSLDLVSEIRNPRYSRGGWNLWFVFLNGLILVAPIWVLHRLWRVARSGPLPLTRRQRRLTRLRRGRCPDCGYDVRGLPQRRCPECGATWSADETQAVPTGP